jgi:hypothetical protein
MPGASGLVNVIVTDLSGKVVLSATMSAAAGTVDLGQFENGVYLVNFQMGAQASSLRVIKQ